MIFYHFSSLDGKNLDESAMLSAIRRLSAEAGIVVKVESSKEMFEKIMGKAQRIRSESNPLTEAPPGIGSLSYVDYISPRMVFTKGS